MGFTNFPVQLTSFIGREREIADIKHLLSSSHLVTLTGAGGSGKTRLAVFTAGFTLDLAEAVCCGDGLGEGRTLDRISSLVNNSLVMADTIGRAQARYHLLETICEYVLEKLDEANETARLGNRHLDLFLARAEGAAPKLNDAYQELWLNWLEGENDNLRAALAWSLESGRIEGGTAHRHCTS